MEEKNTFSSEKNGFWDAPFEGKIQKGTKVGSLLFGQAKWRGPVTEPLNDKPLNFRVSMVVPEFYFHTENIERKQTQDNENILAGVASYQMVCS